MVAFPFLKINAFHTSTTENDGTVHALDVHTDSPAIKESTTLIRYVCYYVLLQLYYCTQVHTSGLHMYVCTATMLLYCTVVSTVCTVCVEIVNLPGDFSKRLTQASTSLLVLSSSVPKGGLQHLLTHQYQGYSSVLYQGAHQCQG